MKIIHDDSCERKACEKNNLNNIKCPPGYIMMFWSRGAWRIKYTYSEVELLFSVYCSIIEKNKHNSKHLCLELCLISVIS